MNIAHIVLTVVLAALLAMTGGGKLAGATSSHRIRDSLAVPSNRWRAIGAFEILIVIGLVVGLWVQTVGLLAALGVVVLMIGAIATRVRAGGRQRNRGVIADAGLLVVAIIAAAIAAA
jgi:DoxX-like protein